MEAAFSRLVIIPICCYLSSPTFLTPFHLFYPEVSLCSQPVFTTPMAICTQRQVRKTWNERRYSYCFMAFSPSHYPPTQWDCSGRSEWHFQTENLKLHFNTQPLSCHRNNTRRLIWVLTNSHLFHWQLKFPPLQSNIYTQPYTYLQKKCHWTKLHTTPKI